MVIFSIQFDLDVASGQKLEGNVTTLHKLGLGLPWRSLVRWSDRWYVGGRESTIFEGYDGLLKAQLELLSSLMAC